MYIHVHADEDYFKLTYSGSIYKYVPPIFTFVMDNSLYEKVFKNNRSHEYCMKSDGIWNLHKNGSFALD